MRQLHRAGCGCRPGLDTHPVMQGGTCVLSVVTLPTYSAVCRRQTCVCVSHDPHPTSAHLHHQQQHCDGCADCSDVEELCCCAPQGAGGWHTPQPRHPAAAAQEDGSLHNTRSRADDTRGVGGVGVLCHAHLRASVQRGTHTSYTRLLLPHLHGPHTCCYESRGRYGTRQAAASRRAACCCCCL